MDKWAITGAQNALVRHRTTKWYKTTAVATTVVVAAAEPPKVPL